jgi:hypothetical protein
MELGRNQVGQLGYRAANHPILSQISTPAELQYEVCGARELIEKRFHRKVHHFCYPNGPDVDISASAVDTVCQAGYARATTTRWGLNTQFSDRVRLRRLPFGDSALLQYAVELLVGLHV